MSDSDENEMSNMKPNAILIKDNTNNTEFPHSKKIIITKLSKENGTEKSFTSTPNCCAHAELAVLDQSL